MTKPREGEGVDFAARLVYITHSIQETVTRRK